MTTRTLFPSLIALCLLLGLSAQAEVSHEPSAAVKQRMFNHNRRLMRDDLARFRAEPPRADVLRPFAEYETAKYLLITDETPYNTQHLKDELVRNLPDPMIAVILVSRESNLASVQAHYSHFISPSRLRVAYIQGGAGFWSRDSLPIPVFTKSEQKLGVVDAKYHHGNQPDSQIAELFSAKLFKHDYFYEGGNFLADTKGNCLLIKRDIPDQIFQSLYGCKNVVPLPYKKGIGHIDESVKALSNSVAVTDHEAYRPVLTSLGYEVKLLPRPAGEYETYVNSLLVNGTLYVPVFGQPSDQVALQVYSDLGFNVIPLDSSRLSKGRGSIHCITMTYPDADLEELLRSLSQ